MVITSKHRLNESLKDYHLERTKVLYVEDEQIIRESISRCLRRRIKELFLAQNGKEGLALFKEHNPDIVVTDIRMPMMNGLEMAMEIKNINCDTPIIITTAYNDEEYFLKAIDIGIDKYIKKPINNTDLLNVLIKSARNISQQREIDAKNEFIKTILDNNPTFIMITDCDSTFFLNKSFLSFLGFTGFDEFSLKCKTISRFLVLKEESFYKGKSFSEWIREVIGNPEREFIVYMSGKNELKSEAKAYILHANKIPETQHLDKYLVSFTDISSLEWERQKYQDMACKDYLTNIYNRKKFEEELNKEIDRVKRYDMSLSIIIFDIDHFKQVNDVYGHQAGDLVLQEVCMIVLQHVRKTDIFARYGGEEFIILTPETSLEGARELAEKLREIIQDYNFTTIKHMTCSFGVSQYVKEETAGIFVKKADYALYIAKNKGRNKVKVVDKEHSTIFNSHT